MAHQQVAVTDDGDRNMDADECDATKMTLTPEETARAIEVKDMVESLDHINNLTDMEYAQFALTSKPDTCVDKIVDCIYKLQCFREEYRIQDTIEEGAQLMRELMLSQPGYILSVDFAPKFRTYIYVFDFAAFDPSKIKSRHEWKVFMGGTFYIFKCLTTNLQAIREGVVFITECDGMQSGNFDWQLEEKFMHELMHNFPFRYKECVRFVYVFFLGV